MKAVAWGLMFFGTVELIFVGIDQLLMRSGALPSRDRHKDQHDRDLGLRDRGEKAVWQQAALHRRFLPLWIAMSVGGGVLLLVSSGT